MSTIKRTTNYTSGKIYKITNSVNNMLYIGSTTQTLGARMSEHRAYALKRESVFYNAMKEIGRDQFKIMLIEDYPCQSKTALEAREFALMNTFDHSLLFNSITNGKHSVDSRSKMSASHFGFEHTLESKHNMSVAKRATVKRGCESHMFKRGGICDNSSRCTITLTWFDEKVRHSKAFCYKSKRTREAAYMECINLRNSIYPLSFADYAAELPFNNCD